MIFPKKVKRFISQYILKSHSSEPELLALGKLLSNDVIQKKEIKSLEEVEFKIFSQWGDDGIIQWLIHNIDLPHRTFVEFGVESYRESNTRFLMMNNNWSGLVMDGSSANIEKIVNSEYFWKYSLDTKAVFIDKENINNLLLSSEMDKEVGILHVDIDGNDYWIWKEINVISPIIVILEYNAVLGIDRPITIPYQKDFYRTKAHYSNLYYGASLKALYDLSMEKGYSFIGCNTAGNNAYFVRRDKLNDNVKEISLEKGYVMSKFRENRHKENKLDYIRCDRRLNVILNLPVYNTETNQVEKL